MRIIMVLISLLSISFLSQPDAAIYKYADEYGGEFYTNRVEAIPEKYIRRAEIIDDHLDKTGLMIEPERHSKITIEVFDNTGGIFQGTRHAVTGYLGKIDALLVNSETVKYTIGIITFVFIFFLLFSIREYVGPGKIGMMLIALMGIFTFLLMYGTYIKKIVDNYAYLNRKTLEQRKQTEDRYRLIEEVSVFNKEDLQKREKIIAPWERRGSHEK
jgi:hypothetical protein